MSARPARFGDGLTVGENLAIRRLGHRFGAGEPFCVTRELIEVGSDRDKQDFRRVGRGGVHALAERMVSDGLLKREGGRDRYSLTAKGAGEYLAYRSERPKVHTAVQFKKGNEVWKARHPDLYPDYVPRGDGT